MASGRIEQQIDLKVNGLKDVKEAEKIVDGLDGTKAKVTIEADATKAQRTVKDVLKDVDKLDSTDAQIVLSLRAAAVEQELSDILQDVAKVDGEQATIDVELARAGELRGDLDQLQSKIKEIGDTKVDIDTTPVSKGFDDIGKSVDSAKSVSANAIGNITQDLGALGGVAGSAGVAIGQFGEYFADAAASGEESIGSIAKNFLTVAGPLTVATVAVGLLTEAFQSMQKAAAETKAFNRDRVDSFVDALHDAKLTAEELEEVLSTGGEGPGIFIRVADETKNADVAVAKLFGSLENFNSELGKGLPGYDAWAAKQLANAKAANATEDQIAKLKVVLDDARDGSVNATAAAVAQSEGLTTVQQAAIAYAAAIRDSGAATDRATFEARFFGTELDKNAPTLDENTKASVDFAAGMHKLAVEQEAATEAAKAFNHTIHGAEFAAAGLQGGISGMSTYHERLFGLKNIAAQTEEAFDNLGESLKDNGKTFDLNTEKGRANQKAVEDLAGAVDLQLAAAFDDAGGSFDNFNESATNISNTLRTKLIKEMGLSEQQADDMIRQLGLMPEDMETRYALSGTEEARVKIGLLQGSIDALPKDVQAKVTQQIIAGDYVGALATVNNYYATHPGTIPTNVKDPNNLSQTLSNVQDYLNKHPQYVNVSTRPTYLTAGGTNSMPEPGGVAGEAGGEFVRMPNGRWGFVDTPTYLPPRTKVISVARTRSILRRGGGLRGYAAGTGGNPLGNVTVPVQVNISTAVIGNRYDVERAVRRATRDGVRLAGTR